VGGSWFLVGKYGREGKYYVAWQVISKLGKKQLAKKKPKKGSTPKRSTKVNAHSTTR